MLPTGIYVHFDVQTPAALRFQLDVELILPGRGPGLKELERIDHVPACYRDPTEAVIDMKACSLTVSLNIGARS